VTPCTFMQCIVCSKYLLPPSSGFKKVDSKFVGKVGDFLPNYTLSHPVILIVT